MSAITIENKGQNTAYIINRLEGERATSERVFILRRYRRIHKGERRLFLLPSMYPRRKGLSVMECVLCDKEVAYFVTAYDGFCDKHNREIEGKGNK